MRHISAFTLIEMMVVMAVIAALAGISIAVLPNITKGNQVKVTKALVIAVAAATEAYGASHHQIYDTSIKQFRQLPAWDIDADSILDGDPARGEFNASFRAGDLILIPDYPGALLGLNTLQVPDNRVNELGRITDSWGQPLHIVHAGPGSAPAGADTGRHFIGIYSLGPDGEDDTSAVTGDDDDIRSW
ncbi:MAG: type II secretion system protein [Planctomycetota bacterium]|nr:type II secretion system protein [Planctomycetota bacterium]